MIDVSEMQELVNECVMLSCLQTFCKFDCFWLFGCHEFDECAVNLINVLELIALMDTELNSLGNNQTEARYVSV